MVRPDGHLTLEVFAPRPDKADAERIAWVILSPRKYTELDGEPRDPIDWGPGEVSEQAQVSHVKWMLQAVDALRGLNPNAEAMGLWLENERSEALLRELQTVARLVNELPIRSREALVIALQNLRPHFVRFWNLQTQESELTCVGKILWDLDQGIQSLDQWMYTDLKD